MALIYGALEKTKGATDGDALIAAMKGARSLRPSATKTRRGFAPMASAAAAVLLTSVQRSPAILIHGGRRSAMKATPVWRAASTALAEITLA